MAEVVYALCALTSIGCAALLFRHYRSGRTRLLLWCSLAFFGLALNNILLVIDFEYPAVDLSLARNLTALASLLVLVFGLVWSSGGPRA